MYFKKLELQKKILQESTPAWAPARGVAALALMSGGGGVLLSCLGNPPPPRVGLGGIPFPKKEP